MAISRHFLGWDAPVTDKVCDGLLPGASDGVVDLSDTLVIVPTRQAGRRLREALALRCAGKDTALIPPRVEVPTFFLQPADATSRVAGPMLTGAIWCDLLRRISTADYAGLFPVPPEQDQAWALHTAELIQHLRQTLADGGYLISDVIRQYGAELEEPDRWNDLARLEGQYLKRMEETGLEDRCAHLIKQSDAPVPPDGIRRIVVAAVPDPSLLMVRALEKLAATWPVDVLVHAPESRAADFDAWGRPRADVWTGVQIDFPEEERNVLLGATPMDQARRTLEIIAEESARIGPADLAIGVPDSDVTPFIDAHLADHGLIAFNPAGRSVTQHRLYHVLDRCRALMEDPDYRSISAFLRHPDVLRALYDRHRVAAAPLLAQLDEFQNAFLPQNMEDVRRALAKLADDAPLRVALSFIDIVRSCQDRKSTDQIIGALMERIYANQEIDPQNPEDEAFRLVAVCINRLIVEARHPSFIALDLPIADVIQLILRALSGETIYEERKDAQVDLEGWLELPWNNARVLIVTGMNEGKVPDGRITDAFLPDSLRVRLGLHSDAERLGRDAYLMTSLIESRRAAGRISFIAGALSRTRDPLRPSRL